MKKVLVINIGWEQEPLVDALAALNDVELYAIHYNQDYYKGQEYKEVFIADLRDLVEIRAFAQRIQPDAVFSDQCDYSNFAQALIAYDLGLPGPDLESAQIQSNKYLQRLKSKEKGVGIPEFKLVVQEQDIVDFIAEIGYPVILKPVDNRGSFGISKISSEADIKSAYCHAIEHSHSRLVLVEKFIVGQQITVDGYVFDGQCKTLSIATKGMVDKTTQVAIDIKYPGDLAEELYQKAAQNSEFVCTQLGYSFGMTHAEYMIDEQNNIYLIEAANRGGGVYTSEIIVPQVSGIDILGQYIADGFGDKTSSPLPNVQQNPTILKFYSFAPGKIKEIGGIDEIQKDPALLKFRLAVKVGDTIEPITSDANRHGFVIVSAPNVREKANDLIHKIKITYYD